MCAQRGGSIRDVPGASGMPLADMQHARARACCGGTSEAERITLGARAHGALCAVRKRRVTHLPDRNTVQAGMFYVYRKSMSYAAACSSQVAGSNV